jgi:hypothetical protein
LQEGEIEWGKFRTMAQVRRIEPEKHSDGRWMYSDLQLLRILRLLSLKRRVKILERAINIMEDYNRPKIYAVASALDCIYDDAGFWGRKTKIKVSSLVNKKAKILHYSERE